MEQLIYISTSRPMKGPTHVEVESVLEVSRRNNARDNLTGLLIVGGRRFLQVLEGPSVSLTATYDRIKEDSRHFALVQLSRKAITERSFPGWDMGFDATGARLIEIVFEMTNELTDPFLRAQFESFALLHQRAV